MIEKIHIEKRGECAIIVRGLGPYSLRDTLECGQVFRYEKIEGTGESQDEYLVTTHDMLIHVGQDRPGELIFYGLSDEEFDRIVAPYFSLYRDLDEIREDVKGRTGSEWLQRAAELGGGIAILTQRPFETLISFIISQNNNIPRIKKIIKMIAVEYGVNLTLQKNGKKCPLGLCSGTPCEEKCRSCGVCYTFPTAEDILARPEGLLPSHPGFRYPYILDAAEKVATGAVDLEEIMGQASYEYTLAQLKKIKGVGDKVASCVALFAFSNLEAFPIDVWMKRAIDTYFNGALDPKSLGKYAGVAQQYIFHLIRNGEGGK